MESSIKVDFRDDGKGLQPIIAVKLKDSEDPRDGLLKAFFQQLGGQSSWLVASFDGPVVEGVSDGRTFITLHPVKPDELKETVRLIERRLPFEGIGVMDNCTGFHDFLKEQGIEFRPNGHFTTILKEGVDLFALGQKFNQYKDRMTQKQVV